MSTVMTRVKRDVGEQTQRNRAYESLRRALILRQIPEGQRLREPRWAQRLGVNRAALREALARLHAEGLVIEGEKTGYFVPRLSEDDVEETIEVRVMIETQAVERIIRLGLNRRDKLKPLRELCDDLEWMLDRGYSLEVGEADLLFHSRLMELSRNRRLIQLHRCLPHVKLAEIDFKASHHLASSREILEQHRALIDAIQKGRTAEARQIIHRHFAVPGGQS